MDSRMFIIIQLAIACVALLSVAPTESEAGVIADYFACKKENLMKSMQEKFVANSPALEAIKNAHDAAQIKFQEELASNPSLNDDEVDRENAFQKVFIEELKRVNREISRSDQPTAAKTPESSSTDELLSTCVNISQDAEMQERYKNWDPRAELNSALETTLNNELDDVNELNQIEEEMGFAMTPETRKALKSRTNELLSDVLNNELKQLAMTSLSVWLTGGSWAPVMYVLQNGIGYKILDYMVSAFLDIVAAITGREVQIKPRRVLTKDQMSDILNKNPSSPVPATAPQTPVVQPVSA